jgi:putative ABC transport system ATP-binding protein
VRGEYERRNRYRRSVTAVRVRDLHFGYDTPAGPLPVLRGIDVDIAGATTTAVTGTSGSGKTTLLSVLGGLDRAGAGSVVVGDADLATLDRNAMARYRRDVVGFVFQDFGLLGQLTALENVELALTLSRNSRRARRARARDLLTAAGLGERLTHRPHALSGGEKQRVAIARALANEPQLVLADEPTGNLDAVSTTSVLDMLLRVPVEHGATVVVVTHDEAVAARADVRLRLVDGKVAS